jgi:hypothetical protein
VLGNDTSVAPILVFGPLVKSKLNGIAELLCMSQRRQRLNSRSRHLPFKTRYTFRKETKEKKKKKKDEGYPLRLLPALRRTKRRPVAAARAARARTWPPFPFAFPTLETRAPLFGPTRAAFGRASRSRESLPQNSQPNTRSPRRGREAQPLARIDHHPSI